MIEALRHLLLENPVGLLFTILAVGYLIGKAKLRGFELGPVTGVLFAGLVFGHRGFELSPHVQTFGFVLFIFSVGFQAGPNFFTMLRREGPRYFLLAVVVAAVRRTSAGPRAVPVGSYPTVARSVSRRVRRAGSATLTAATPGRLPPRRAAGASSSSIRALAARYAASEPW